MKFPKTRQELDDFIRKYNLRPVCVTEYKGRDIFVAESDHEMNNPAYPWGYYRTAWFVTKPDSQEAIEIGRYLDFDAMHDKDKGWTTSAKRDARMNAAIKDGCKWIDRCKQVGHYQ